MAESASRALVRSQLDEISWVRSSRLWVARSVTIKPQKRSRDAPLVSSSKKALDNSTVDPSSFWRRLALIPVDLAILVKYGCIH